jgi:uncharacterized protein (TIGR02453 family)
MLQRSTISFLKGLKKNNNKPWFEEHRAQYETARLDFQSFIKAILDEHAKNDEDILPLQVKDCLFRINRDVRFSKDKSPYKTNFGASLARGGKKSPFAGYYFHCEAGESFAGGGIWMPQPPETKKIRQEIDYCLTEFNGIVTAKPFLSVYGSLSNDDEYRLANIPKGYEKDNPAASYLKYKSWIALHPLTDADLTSESLAKTVTDAFKALQPLVKFLNRAIEE